MARYLLYWMEGKQKTTERMPESEDECTANFLETQSNIKYNFENIL